MSGYIPSFFFQNYQNTNGLVLAGGSLTTYISETTVPKSLYYDIDLQNPTPNPIVFDSAGICPQYFMESGAYTFILKDANGNTIATRDNVVGAIPSSQSISATSATYQVKIDDNDTNPGFLWNKLFGTDTIDLVNTGDKITINVRDSFKLKSNPSDPNPNYLNEKIMNTDTVILSISANKLRADFSGPTLSTSGYLFSQFQNSDSITWTTSATKILANVISGKIQVSSADTLEYLEDKIHPGAGIVFTKTSDINGQQLHISTTNNTINAGKVKVTSGDSLEYLADKLIAGNGIIISTDDNNITISNSEQLLGYVQSVIPFTSAIRVTNTNLIAVTNIVISAGTWDIQGNVLGYIIPVTSSTNPPGINSNINTSIVFENDGNEAYAFIQLSGGGTRSTTLSSRRLTVAGLTTIYLLSQCRFGEFVYCDFWGNITARQVS